MHFETRMIEVLQVICRSPALECSGEATSIVQVTAEAVTLPEGRIAEDAVIAEITTAVRGLAACNAAGDYLAGLGGTTDDFVVSQVGRALFAEHHTMVLGVREVTVHDVGQLSAPIDYYSFTPQVEGIDVMGTHLYIFENVEGQWLLDESIENLECTLGLEDIAMTSA